MPKHAFKKLYRELKFFVNIIIIIMMMIMMMMMIIIINNNNIALGNTGKRKQGLTG